jgi:predicted subunit of tRNA(5-methylaminomethyl-2-thiouridylate) methyltransferase
LKQKDYLDSIICFNIKDLTEKEIQRLLFELEELISEFKEEGDYETIIKHIEKKNTNDASARLCRL